MAKIEEFAVDSNPTDFDELLGSNSDDNFDTYNYRLVDISDYVRTNILITDITSITATSAEINKLTGTIVTTQEINYLDGLTGPIQTQLNAKQASFDNTNLIIDNAIPPRITLRSSAGPISGAEINRFAFDGFDSNSANQNYGSIRWIADDVTASTIDGSMQMWVSNDGAAENRLTIDKEGVKPEIFIMEGTDPFITFKSTEAAADGNEVGRIDFVGLNSTSDDVTYGTVHFEADDVTNATEDSYFKVRTIKGGTSNEVVHIGERDSVYIGSNITHSFGGSIVVGNDVTMPAFGADCVVIGNDTSGGTSLSNNVTAIGNRATATAGNATSLGDSADATASYATAIGSEAQATVANTVVLGRALEEVRIPGDLDITGDAVMGTKINFPELATNPTFVAATYEGTIHYNTTDNTFYGGDDTTWVDLAGGGSGPTGIPDAPANGDASVDYALRVPITGDPTWEEVSSGGTYILPAATSTTLGGVIVEGSSAIDVDTDGKIVLGNINQVVNIQNSVASTDPEIRFTGDGTDQVLGKTTFYFDSSNYRGGIKVDRNSGNGYTFNVDVGTVTDAVVIEDDTSLRLGSTGTKLTNSDVTLLTSITATADELNVLDGITSSTAELNILDGVTATATEINLLDGKTESDFFDATADHTLTGDVTFDPATGNNPPYFPDGMRIGSDASANELDDYEEGTWTPAAVNFIGTGNETDFTDKEASYTKIGNVVHLKCRVTVPLNTDTSNFQISGLPFTANQSYGSSGNGTAAFINTATENDVNSCIIVPTLPSILFNDGSDRLTYDGINQGTLGLFRELRLELTYETNA